MSPRLPLVALGLVTYTYVGYPLAIGLLARLAPNSVRRDESYTPTVSVLLSAFNAADYLEAKLDSLAALEYPSDKIEFIVLSDGSTDGTDAILAKRHEADPRFRWVRREERSGKPSGINRLKELASGEILILTDARQPLAPRTARALVSHFVDPQVGCVSGNLVLEGEAGAGVYWRYEKWIREQEARFRSVVGVTGAIYAIRRAEMPTLPDDIILDDVFTPMTLRLEGKKILFEREAIATEMAFDDDREFNRKARTLAGNYQLFSRMPALLDPFANPSWFETMSHKTLRLAGPFILATLLGSSLAALRQPQKLGPGERAFMQALVLGQLVFYGAAALGPRAGKLPGVARTFVTMNAAALVGLVRHLKKSQRIAW
jgi:cellulose synthase/poly-beta-1,6-N-acetylglucosamine synthase-like glycosyltransferase